MILKSLFTTSILFKRISLPQILFRPNKRVEYENNCPECYTLNGILGFYDYIDHQTIEISSNSLSIYRKFIDRIETSPNEKSKLTFEVLDEESKSLGNVLTINYTISPTLFPRKRSISLQHDDLDLILNKNVKLNNISIEVFDKGKRKLYYIPLDWKLKPEAKTYSIILRKTGYRIVHKNGKTYLYQWDHRRQRFKKEDELMYTMD